MALGSYRALYTTALGRLFAVVGSQLFEIYKDKTAVRRGVLTTSKGNVSIAENDTQLLIIDGAAGWVYTLLYNTFEKIKVTKDVVDTIGVNTGGTGYRVGDILSLPKPTGGATCTLQVYSIDESGAVTQAGLSIVAKGRGYAEGTYTASGGYGSGCIVDVESLTDNGWTPGTHVIVIDGYFLKNEVNSNRFTWSYSRDGLTWDALDYASAEGSSDNIIAVNKVNNEAYLFGSKTTEIWYDSGSTESGQFNRIQQGFLDIGIAAPWSSATLGNQIFWLGADNNGQGIVWSATNYSPERISTHAIEYIISKISKETTISDAVGYCYQQEGHFYYVLNFTKGQRTLVYDTKSKMWHERGWWNAAKNRMERHRAQCLTFNWGKVLVGDYLNSNLYELDLDTYTDNGDPIRRIRTGPHIRNDRKRLFHQEFEVDLQRGVGLVHTPLTAEAGSEPFMTLTYSDDGGSTFTSERKLTIGRLGTYNTRAHCHRLGMSRDRVYRLTISDPVKVVLIGARIDIEPERGV